MKKKILLAISLTCLMICLFAISAFAVEIDGIYYDLKGSGENAYAIVNAENRSKCVLETVTIPATITTDDGVTYKVTEIASNAFGQVNGDVNGKIKHLVIGANVSTVGEHAFRRVTSLETVKIENTDASNGINFYNAQFMDCKNLKSVSAAKAKIAEYGDYCFWNCNALVTVDYPSTLTRIGKNAFRDCWNLTSGDLSNTNVTTIDSWGYGSAKGITNFKFPSTLTTIGNNNFLYCPVTTFVFPHSMSSFGQHMLAHTGSTLKMLVMPALDSNDSLNSDFLHDTKPRVIIYAGNNVNEFVAMSSDLSGYEKKPFSEYDPKATYTKNTIFYGATTCEFCNGLLEDERFNFTGYENEFYYASKCTNCQKDNVTESYEPMFINSGYSFAEYEKGVITLGFRVNDESIAAYEKITGEAVKYGLYAATEKVLGNNDILDENGEILSGVISAEIPREQFSLLDIKIFGFNTEEQRNALFIIGAYVISEKNGAKTVSYIQDGTPAEGSKHAYVTFNGVVA